jgi:hypothetical protein
MIERTPQPHTSDPARLPPEEEAVSGEEVSLPGPQPAHPTAARSRLARMHRIQRVLGNRAAGRIVQRGWLDDIGSAISDAVGSVADAAASIVDDFDTKSRGLTGPEITAAKDLFGDTIDYSLVVIERNSLYNAGSSRTIGNTIALTDSKFSGNGMTLNAAGRQTLMHELAHVWQYQNQGWTYAPEALWAQFKAWWNTGSRNAAYDWEQLADSGVPWEQWNPEAQAEAVEDYNRALRRKQAGEATASDIATLAKAQPFIDKMKAGPPKEPPAPASRPWEGAEGGPPAYPDDGAGGGGGTSSGGAGGAGSY